MDQLEVVLEKLAECDKLDKAIGVLESASSKPLPIVSHSHDAHRDDTEISPGTLQIEKLTTKLFNVISPAVFQSISDLVSHYKRKQSEDRLKKPKSSPAATRKQDLLNYQVVFQYV